MSARHPLSYITADPVVGATRLDDDRDAEDAAHEAELALAELEAPLIVLAQLQALKTPGDWFRQCLAAGGLYSPDELLCEAVNEDDDTKDRIAELMTSPAVIEVHKAMAAFAARKRALAIYQEHTEARH